MAANNELSEIQRRVLDYVKQHPDQNAKQIIWNCVNTSLNVAEIRQALSNLTASGYLIGSADTPIRYKPVGT